MKFYVATKFENLEEARAAMNVLDAVGHEITHDWTAVPQESPEAAVDDINGVTAADALIVLMEHDLPYQGTLFEIGCALGQGKTVYIVGNAPITNTLFIKFHPLIVKVSSLSEVLYQC